MGFMRAKPMTYTLQEPLLGIFPALPFPDYQGGLTLKWLKGCGLAALAILLYQLYQHPTAWLAMH